ncbi:MAG: hypothetical protein B7Y25_01850 [Alphaproteobacteria bacterium 16-39-46]|nr:MAG: hypothetical protein B7Y25_01850 [Alphaproteobacteria bacterium 16-39-46]OZA43900.1 MAG: hypothetical protein B7X84_01870 [Alphaproteobacteria bacterium 17-39-52]HQS83689.1 Gfo/Idh/MocA family oxidoreductase [Alphaproteobacteria bacterium]HQS93457.1 Gfo/Idh/MocA family oxidoreductase [Alphaproteobacteria bacterium]
MTAQFPKCVVVGCGSWGENLVRTLVSLEALGGIVEKNETRALDLSKLYHIPVFEFEDVLKNDAIHGIFIATSSQDRGSLAQQAFEHQKHVFIEKPVAFTEKNAQILYDVSLKSNRHIMGGHLLLHHPVFQKMKDMVQKEMIGEIKCLQTSRKNFGKFFKNESVLWDFGPHDLSMIWELLPTCKKKMPHQITSQALYEREDIADVVETTLLFSDIAVQMSLSRLSPYKEQKIVALGTKGSLCFDDTKPWDEKLLYTPILFNSEDKEALPLKKDEKYIKVPEEEPLKNECLAFLRAIQKNEKSEAFLEALMVTSILEKIQKELK